MMGKVNAREGNLGSRCWLVFHLTLLPRKALRDNLNYSTAKET